MLNSNSKKNNKVNNNNKPRKNKSRANGNDKTVGESVAIASRSGPRMPKTTNRGGGGTVVTHTETFGQNIVGTSAFSLLDTWALQPGLSTYSRGEPLGVWLPQIAANFDHYEIESLKFRYRTACSTLTPGLAVFAFEPNPEGSAPQTYQEMRNMFSTDGSVHTNITFDVTQKVKGRRLIRKGPVANLPSYDMGKVHFGTIGVTEGALCGFIDVEYKIRLLSPQASQTTTIDSGVVTSLPVIPTQRFTVDTSAFSSINCAEASMEYFNALLYFSPQIEGAPLASILSNRSVAAADTTVLRANKFKNAQYTGNYRVLRIGRSGRYRFTIQPRLDYQDLKLFAAALFKYDSSVSSATTMCSKQVYLAVDGSLVGTVASPVYAHRGFAGTAVGDPNPGTEVFPTWVFDFDATQDNFDFCFKLGVLTYNSESTTTATIIGRTGLGDTVMELQYLGPLITV